MTRISQYSWEEVGFRSQNSGIFFPFCLLCRYRKLPDAMDKTSSVRRVSPRPAGKSSLWQELHGVTSAGAVLSRQDPQSLCSCTAALGAGEDTGHSSLSTLSVPCKIHDLNPLMLFRGEANEHLCSQIHRSKPDVQHGDKWGLISEGPEGQEGQTECVCLSVSKTHTSTNT